jgi:hypothetical protein
MFGEIELKRFGDGREDVGLIRLMAEENCVWPNNWLPARGAAIFGFVANGFLGTAGVSKAGACGR